MKFYDRHFEISEQQENVNVLLRERPTAAPVCRNSGFILRRRINIVLVILGEYDEEGKTSTINPQITRNAGAASELGIL